MLWTNPAIVLSARPFGEGKAIASLLTEDHGRYSGVVPGGAGKRRSLLQPGSLVSATWRARVPEQLGVLTLEPLRGLGAAIIRDRLRLAALAATCSLLDAGLPEREPNRTIYQHTLALLRQLGGEEGGEEACLTGYARWEWCLVAALGFGLTAEVDVEASSVSACNDTSTIGPVGIAGDCSAADRPIAVQLRRTRVALEEHVFASGRQGLPSARYRLADLIERGW